MAEALTLGVPAGVNPPNATQSPFFTKFATSLAVISFMAMDISGSFTFVTLFRKNSKSEAYF
jgi:hypothetical protein